MGTTAEKIARNVAAQVKAPVVDLAPYRWARQLIKEAKIDRDGFEQRITEAIYLTGIPDIKASLPHA